MQGRLQATIAASSLALLSLLFPPVSIVSSAAIALITLRRGASEGLYILGCGTIAAGLLGFFIQGNFQYAIAFLLLWLPIWLISTVLREGQNLSLAVGISVFIGMLGIIGVYVFVTSPASMWKPVLAQIITQMAPTGVPIENIRQAVEILSRYMTGTFFAGIVITLLSGLFLGRWWQAILYNPGGFKQEFLALTTGPRFTLAALVVIGMAFAKLGVMSEIATNIAAILFVLYVLIGIAILHTVFAAKSYGKHIVPMFYITLILIPINLKPFILLAIALVGLSDMWLDLRKNKFKPTDAK
jgi:hypothetical protein